MRVLVVGAGPTGLCAALELARRGVESLVVERRASASTLSRAVGITPRSLQLLEDSGVSERWIEDGVRFAGGRLYRNRKLLLELPFAVDTPEYGYDFILGLAQDRTEAHLEEAYRTLGGEVRYGCELVDFDASSDGVTAHFSVGPAERFDFIIGADGVESTVRELAGIAFPGYELPETWSIADVEASRWQNPEHFTVCLLDGEVVVVAPLESARFRLVSSTRDALACLPLDLEVDRVRRQDTFQISVRVASRYREGRVFLAGDAAHCHSPVGGRGMNLGLADAATLAEQLVAGDAESYESLRKPEAERVVSGSERFRRLAVARSRPVRWFSDRGLGIVARSPWLQRRLAGIALYA